MSDLQWINFKQYCNDVDVCQRVASLLAVDTGKSRRPHPSVSVVKGQPHGAVKPLSKAWSKVTLQYFLIRQNKFVVLPPRKQNVPICKAGQGVQPK